MIVKRNDSSRAGGRRSSSSRSAAAPAAAAAAIAQARASRRLRRTETIGATPAADPSEIHFSSFPTSPADCQRSSGSLARHVLTTRSSAGGDMGWTERSAGAPCAGSRRSATPGSIRRERLPARRHLVERGSEGEDVGPRVGVLALRAAPAPCTGTFRGSCPPASDPAAVGRDVRLDFGPRRAPSPSPARSPAASPPTSSALRCRASGPDARSPAGAPCPARPRSPTP